MEAQLNENGEGLRRIIETGLQESVTGINAHVAIASQSLQEQYAQHTSNIAIQARVVAEDIDKFAQLHASLQTLEQEKLDATIQEKVVAQVEKIQTEVLTQHICGLVATAVDSKLQEVGHAYMKHQESMLAMSKEIKQCQEKSQKLSEQLETIDFQNRNMAQGLQTLRKEIPVETERSNRSVQQGLFSQVKIMF